MPQSGDEQPSHATPQAPDGKARPRRVLVTEDDGPFRLLLASVLRGDGYEVIEAADGLELLSKLEQALAARHERPDTFVVVADVHMPGLTGLDVVSILRCASCATPVILITAFGDEETRAEALELGVNAVFDKPFELDALRTAVEEAAAL